MQFSLLLAATAVAKAETPYWKRLTWEAWQDTWSLVVGQPLSRLIVAGVIIMSSIVVYRQWKKVEEFWAAFCARSHHLTDMHRG